MDAASYFDIAAAVMAVLALTVQSRNVARLRALEKSLPWRAPRQ